MNERIAELIYQAEKHARNTISQTGENKFTQFFNERFAELIIKECCNMFVELRTRPADLAAKDVKQHFGLTTD